MSFEILLSSFASSGCDTSTEVAYISTSFGLEKSIAIGLISTASVAEPNLFENGSLTLVEVVVPFLN